MTWAILYLSPEAASLISSGPGLLVESSKIEYEQSTFSIIIEFPVLSVDAVPLKDILYIYYRDIYSIKNWHHPVAIYEFGIESDFAK